MDTSTMKYPISRFRAFIPVIIPATGPARNTGCGPSAHSYNGTSRQWNIASLDKYIAGINNHAPIYEIENLDLYTRYNDFVITTIRTSAGMSLTLLKNTFGDTLYNYCLRMARPHLNQGTLEITNNTLKLTEAGIFISDGIMSDMLWVD